MTAELSPSSPGDSRKEDLRGTKQDQKDGARALRQVLRPVAGWLNLARVLAVVSGVLAIAPYVALVRIGELLLASGGELDTEAVQRWVWVLIGTFTGRLLIHTLALLITHLADIRVGHLIRQQMVDRMAVMPLSWFSRTNSGRVRKTLQDDISTVHTLIAHQPVETVAAVVTPIALMAYAFVIDWRLGLLSIAVLPVFALTMALSLKGMGTKTVEMDRRLGRIAATAVEFVTGITVVKAFGKVGRAHRNYQQAADEFYDFYHGWVQPLLRGSSLGYAVLSIPLSLLINLGGGAWMVGQGWVTPADVLATSLIALVIPGSLTVLSNSSWAYQLAGAAARRITDFLALPVISEEGCAVPDGHEVVFDRVSYSYDDHQAVRDVSFRLPEGTVTALLGPSGAGKSTVATLLARFDDPDSGTVTLGGVPLPEIRNLYSHIGFVLQDPQLPAISLRENIALGRPGATEEEIRAAARAANILDEIEALPEGFDTVYGASSGLSGGQAQRVAIARVLLADTPVLVLDEATALADPESQAAIQDALSRLVQGRTVLVIAHRPEAVKGADQIIVLNQGQVSAVGTHEQLSTQPYYSTLLQSAAARG